MCVCTAAAAVQHSISDYAFLPFSRSLCGAWHPILVVKTIASVCIFCYIVDVGTYRKIDTKKWSNHRITRQLLVTRPASITYKIENWLKPSSVWDSCILQEMGKSAFRCSAPWFLIQLDDGQPRDEINISMNYTWNSQKRRPVLIMSYQDSANIAVAHMWLRTHHARQLHYVIISLICMEIVLWKLPHMEIIPLNSDLNLESWKLSLECSSLKNITGTISLTKANRKSPHKSFQSENIFSPIASCGYCRLKALS